MMKDKKSARPTAATVGQAGLEAETWQATASTLECTTIAPSRQAGKITDFLSTGQQNAVPLKHLKDLLHLDERTVRLLIRSERLAGVPICEDSRNGYYMPSSADERDTCAKRLRHRAAQIVAVADAIAAADILGGDV